jgi:bis(5'-nucleosidyl)-tetraphosphatase
MKEELSAGAIIFKIDRQTNYVEYLVLHYLSGHWDLAKGHVEGKETPQETALREIKEETDLTVTLDDRFKESLSYFFKNRQGELIKKTVIFFVAESAEKKVTLSREHIGYKWLPKEEAFKQLTFTNAKQLLTQADRFIRTHYLSKMQ